MPLSSTARIALPFILITFSGATARSADEAEEPIDLSLVCFKAAPGKGKFKIDKRLKDHEAVIKSYFKNTKYRRFTFVAKDKLSVADGGSGSVEVGGLTVEVEAERKEDESVTMTVKVSKDGTESSNVPWKNVKPGQKCIQSGPKSGSGRLFVSLSVQ